MPGWARRRSTVNDEQLYRLVYAAWRLASLEARARFSDWEDDRLRHRQDRRRGWHRMQLDFMESDPELSECVMLARLGAEVKFRERL